MENLTKKKWIIVENVLVFEFNNSVFVPKAEVLYSAVIENNYSDIVNEDDVNFLNTIFTFSKFPIELNIVLELTDVNEFSINLKIVATSKDGQKKEIPSLFKADHIIINDTWYPFPTGILEEIFQLLNPLNISQSGNIHLGQYLSLSKMSNELIRNEVPPLKPNSYQSKIDESISGLIATLYPYQEKGLQWLNFMRKEKIGGILADEMGLGKTLQIIGLFCSQKSEPIFPSLVISPATLLENWRREFAKFAPNIKTHIHQGPSRTGFPNEFKRYSIIITSYETVTRDSSLFHQIPWNVVVCDEAQSIKNPHAKRTKSVKMLPRQIGFAVTGTPIENSLTDLWSLMDFAVPDFLGNLSHFQTVFENSNDGAKQLEVIVSPFILKRKILDVAKDLPDRIVIPQALELNADENNLYEQIRIDTINEFTSNSSFAVLTKLRLFCTHPFLVKDNPAEDPAKYSNKYKRLIQIIEEIIANDEKVLVFTSFIKMIDIIILDIKKRFGIYSKSIDGRTPIAERQLIIDEFSSIKGAAMLALNPIAAGTGLNITAANHVIHYNLEWNPSKEDQASARSFRRGQNKPVTIHRLFYVNTIDEAINERLDRKRNLAGTAIIGVQGDENDFFDIVNAINKSPREL